MFFFPENQADQVGKTNLQTKFWSKLSHKVVGKEQDLKQKNTVLQIVQKHSSILKYVSESNKKDFIFNASLRPSTINIK